MRMSISRIGGCIYSHHWTFGCFQESRGEFPSPYHVSTQTWRHSWSSGSLAGWIMHQRWCKNSAIPQGLIAFMFRKLESRSFSEVHWRSLISQRQDASTMKKWNATKTRRDSCNKKEKLKMSVIKLKLIHMAPILGTGEDWLLTRKIDLLLFIK